MMDQKNILFTGSSGLLGSEVRKLLPDARFPSHSEFDVTDYKKMNTYMEERRIELIIHAAAFTSPPRIDENPDKAIEVNIIGTANIVKLCKHWNSKLIYISTDYVFKGDKGNYREDDPVFPINKYAWSKLGGECAVLLYDNSLILRTSFGENEFPYEKAFIDQWTSRIPVKEFAKILVSVLDTDKTGILHIGGPRRTVFEYAQTISPDKNIGKLSKSDVSFFVPEDTSLDTSKFKKLQTKTGE
jgi:dTDP-4-dehydrorhamnose reductase